MVLGTLVDTLHKEFCMKLIKDKDIIEYYKYIDSEFVQPALSSNGTMGGTSFAVNGITNGGVPNFGRGTAYGACYPQTGSFNTYSKGGAPYSAIILYTPNPTLITSFTYSAVWTWAGGVHTSFFASNDNNNWATLYPSTYLGEGTQTINLTNSTRYKYYKLNVQTTGGGSHDGINISGVRLFGTERTVEKGTENDYDFTRTTQIINAIKNAENKLFAVKSYEKGQYYGN